MNMAEMMKSASAASSSGAIDLSEVQDFSMGPKKSSSSSSSNQASTSSIHAALSSAFPSMASKGGKLDDTLNKLMKKNNCVSYDKEESTQDLEFICIFVSIPNRPSKNPWWAKKRNVRSWMKLFWAYQLLKNKRLSPILRCLHRRNLRYHPVYRLHRPMCHRPWRRNNSKIKNHLQSLLRQCPEVSLSLWALQFTLLGHLQGCDLHSLSRTFPNVRFCFFIFYF